MLMLQLRREAGLVRSLARFVRTATLYGDAEVANVTFAVMGHTGQNVRRMRSRMYGGLLI